MQYNRARFYDPEIGRFTTPDPLTGGPDDPTISYFNGIYLTFHRFIIQHIESLQPDKHNRYVYCYNNPINRIDPLGLDDTEPTTQATNLPDPDPTTVDAPPTPTPPAEVPPTPDTTPPGQTSDDVAEGEGVITPQETDELNGDEQTTDEEGGQDQQGTTDQGEDEQNPLWWFGLKEDQLLECEKAPFEHAGSELFWLVVYGLTRPGALFDSRLSAKEINKAKTDWQEMPREDKIAIGKSLLELGVSLITIGKDPSLTIIKPTIESEIEKPHSPPTYY